MASLKKYWYLIIAILVYVVIVNKDAIISRFEQVPQVPTCPSRCYGSAYVQYGTYNKETGQCEYPNYGSDVCSFGCVASVGKCNECENDNSCWEKYKSCSYECVVENSLSVCKKALSFKNYPDCSEEVFADTRYWHDFPQNFELSFDLDCPNPNWGGAGIVLSTCPRERGDDCHCYADGKDLDIREASFGWGYGGMISDYCAGSYVKYDAPQTSRLSYKVVFNGGYVDVHRNGVQVVSSYYFDTQGKNFKSYYIYCRGGTVSNFVIR